MTLKVNAQSMLFVVLLGLVVQSSIAYAESSMFRGIKQIWSQSGGEIGSAGTNPAWGLISTVLDDIFGGKPAEPPPVQGTSVKEMNASGTYSCGLGYRRVTTIKTHGFESWEGC